VGTQSFKTRHYYSWGGEYFLMITNGDSMRDYSTSSGSSLDCYMS